MRLSILPQKHSRTESNPKRSMIGVSGRVVAMILIDCEQNKESRIIFLSADVYFLVLCISVYFCVEEMHKCILCREKSEPSKDAHYCHFCTRMVCSSCDKRFPALGQSLALDELTCKCSFCQNTSGCGHYNQDTKAQNTCRECETCLKCDQKNRAKFRKCSSSVCLACHQTKHTACADCGEMPRLGQCLSRTCRKCKQKFCKKCIASGLCARCHIAESKTGKTDGKTEERGGGRCGCGKTFSISLEYDPPDDESDQDDEYGFVQGVCILCQRVACPPVPCGICASLLSRRVCCDHRSVFQCTRCKDHYNLIRCRDHSISCVSCPSLSGCRKCLPETSKIESLQMQCQTCESNTRHLFQQSGLPKDLQNELYRYLFATKK